MIFFTSDMHFGHKNILRFDNRPFTSIEEMDSELIHRWNQKVKEEDEVYILGDISWYDDQRTFEIMSELHGIKTLIRGNHDRVHGKIRHCFKEVCDYKELNLPSNIHIVLCHYPITFFNRHHYGSFMLYGHVHNSREWNMVENHKFELRQLDIKCNMFNVGCMVRNYEPVTLDEIINQETKENSNVSNERKAHRILF